MIALNDVCPAVPILLKSMDKISPSFSAFATIACASFSVATSNLFQLPPEVFKCLFSTKLS